MWYQLLVMIGNKESRAVNWNWTRECEELFPDSLTRGIIRDHNFRSRLKKLPAILPRLDYPGQHPVRIPI